MLMLIYLFQKIYNGVKIEVVTFLLTCEAETFPEFVTNEKEDCDFYHFGYGTSGFTTFGDYCTTIMLKPEEK